MSVNVELVRSVFAHWERGDFSQTAWAAPDITFVVADGPDQRSLEGLPAMAASWREFLTAWTGYGVQADEYRELDDERVLVLLHAVGSGRTSGLALDQTNRRGANVFHVADGRVRRLVIYFDYARALADLGLAE
jgi:ketosteroid isomerase-like protein